ncbi:MAG: XrtA/PEP-CTERM system amidotransferase [Woeseiaceae bacterium]
MCGITGIVDLKATRPIDEALLSKMNASLTHRGPDGDGFHFSPGVGLGHRRLSIIDLEGGKQPLYNEDGSIVVTYNGEIYNFQELFDELTEAGYRFKTRCDTEVIVHAWHKWGVRCLDRFNGMFAFAIWDSNDDTLFIARDRIGIKPLYYGFDDQGHIAFGSELKALTAVPGLAGKLDPCALEDYFTFGYVPDPRSIYASIQKLAPGHYLKLKRGAPRAEPVRYWDIPLDGQTIDYGTDADLLEGVRERLAQAVKRRMVADVPLGAFLSGGIDSSAVVAMMRDIGTPDLLTCSMGFSEPKFDESKFAQMVADAKKTNHHHKVVEAGDYDLLDTLVSTYDEPYADSSAIPTYRVCQLAREHVTVALSGDGGDENFIGYRRYRLFAMEERLRSMIPASLRRAIFGPLGRFYPKLDWAPRVFRGKTTFQALARSTADAYLHGVSIFPEEGREMLFSDSMKSSLQGYQSREVFANHIKDKNFEDPMKMVQYLDFQTYLPGDILTKVDRASMAHSLEVRVPFLDHELVSWVASLPSSVKLHKGSGKDVLKRALEPSLPHEVLYREKMGFAVPISVWFRDSLKKRMENAVTSERMLDSGYFNPESLQRIVSDHQSGRRDYSAVLWSLLMFDGFLGGEQQRLA